MLTIWLVRISPKSTKDLSEGNWLSDIYTLIIIRKKRKKL